MGCLQIGWTTSLVSTPPRLTRARGRRRPQRRGRVWGNIAASSAGYREALALGEEHAPGRRVFAVDGTDSFGAGLTRFLTGCGEQVIEVGRRERALQALVAAREGAVNAKRAGLCQLRDLLITTPEPLRSQLRPLTRARLLQRLAATRPSGRRDPELRGAMLALRSIARRVLQLTAEERELAREIEALTRKLAPQLLDQPGVGHTPPRSSSSPGHTAAESNLKPPSRGSPARHRSPPPPAKQSATASTEAATANSTAPCT